MSLDHQSTHYYLLSQFELLAKDLDEAGVEDHDLAVLVLGEHLQVALPLSGKINFVQDPLGAVRRLPKVSSHFQYWSHFTITRSLPSDSSQLLLPHTSSLPELVEMVQILLNLKQIKSWQKYELRSYKGTVSAGQ